MRIDHTNGAVLERIEAPSSERVTDVPVEAGSARARLIEAMQRDGYTHRVVEGHQLANVPVLHLSSWWGEGAARYVLPVAGVVRVYTDDPERLERQLFDVFERGLAPTGDSFQARTERRRREAARGYTVYEYHCPEWAEPDLLDGRHAAMTNEMVERDGERLRVWDCFEPAPDPDGSPDGNWRVGVGAR